MTTVVLAYLIGVFAGLRSLTAPAATAWAVHLGWLKLAHPLSLIGSLPTVVILTALAVAELVADKLPRTPNRTSPPGLIARVVTGGVAGACVAAGGGEAVLLGAVVGAIGGASGCFGGYQARKRLVQALRVPDLYIAVLEDLLCIAGSLWVVSRF
jgi:uncharacterized membrane protein